MLTFQANYIHSTSVQRINKLKPCSQNVSFVEINPHSKSDVIAVNRTAISWDKNGGEGFAYDICKALNKGVQDRFFALTTQDSGLENLDFKQILSLAQVKTENEGEEFIEYLQVDPKNTNNAENPQFMHIGTAMLDSLKRLLFNKNIELDSVKSAITFYLRNGFIDKGAAEGGERRMHWESLI